MNIKPKEVLNAFINKKPTNLKKILSRLKLHNTRPNEKLIKEILSGLIREKKIKLIGKNLYQLISIIGKKSKEKSKYFQIDKPIYDAEVICKKYKINNIYPSDCIDEAVKIQLDMADKIDKAKNRKNYCKYPVITIDGVDAKDYDDAVYLEKVDNKYHLQVHIADVSYFIKHGNTLDKEALRRATSVYLCDTVVPMFPFEISNDVCSLKAGQKRLSLSCELVFDENATVLSYDFYSSIIQVARRFNYNEVEKVLDNADEYKEHRKYGPFKDMLLLMWELASKLRENRMKNGSIDFDVPELEIVCDEKSKPIEIKDRERFKSHKLIEEFMLAANIAAAKTLKASEQPTIYRIHAIPDREKVESLKKLLSISGIHTKIGKKITPISFQYVLSEAKGKNVDALINKITLRTMQQAKYSPDNVGHFGLAFDDYTHFTSPIRRYPDLIVHRLLKDVCDIVKKPKSYNMEAELDMLADHCSTKERDAADAERAIRKRKCAHFMFDKLGEEYDAIISDFISFGIFVQIEPYGIEGVCCFRDNVGEYIYNENNFTVTEKRKGIKYKIGDKLKVKVLNVNIHKGIIDFKIID